jgi:hypothetical protein
MRDGDLSVVEMGEFEVRESMFEVGGRDRK